MQIIGDRHGAISHLWERECTIQRRNQKLIEVAPSPSLSEALRSRIIEAAKQLAAAARYDSLGTFEFLVDDDARSGDGAFAFIEANPRLQVEHTVTEEVLGVDLVKSQLAVASGATLASLGLAQASVPSPRGYAMQLRVNMEVMDEKGVTKPTGGTLSVFDLPSGPGVRVDTFGYTGYKTSAGLRFAARQGDRAFAKPELGRRRAGRRACVARVPHRGVTTNVPFLGAVLLHPDFPANRISTGFIDAHVAALVGAAEEVRDLLSIRSGQCCRHDDKVSRRRSGARGLRCECPRPLQGTIVAVDVAPGDIVRPGQQIAVLESMKMEHLVTAPMAAR